MIDFFKSSDLKSALAFVVPYSVAVSALRLFGYWGTFEINPLEYIEASDIVKLAIYPLIVSLLIFIPGFTIAELLFSKKLPPGGGAESRISRFSLAHWRLLVVSLIIIATLVSIYFKEPYKWKLTASLIALLSIPLSHTELAIATFPNPRLRHVILYLLLFIPGLAFSDGKTDAYEAQMGRAPIIVDIARSKLSLSIKKNSPAVYLGRLGDRFVVYETASNGLVLIGTEDAKVLFLTNNSQTRK